MAWKTDCRIPCAAALVLALGLGAASAQERRNVAGRVLDEAGSAVEGAAITLIGLAHPELPPIAAWALGDAGVVRLRARSDARGRFRIELPVTSNYELTVSCDDGRLAPRRFPIVGGEFETLVVARPQWIEGTVRDAAGAPVADALVEESFHLGAVHQLTAYGRVREPNVTRSAQDGRFALRAFDSGASTWHATTRSLRASHARGTTTSDLYRLDAQPLSGLDLVLDGPFAALGSLLDREGQPLSDARVLALELPVPSCSSDAKGGFALERSFRGPLVVLAKDHAIPMPNRAANGAALKLEPGASFAFRAVDASGPCASRRVLLATQFAATWLEVAWLEQTDHDGRLVVTEAIAGQRLEVWIESGTRFVPLLAHQPGETHEDLGELRIPATRTLSGAVRDAEGLPAAGAMVALWRGDAADPRRLQRIAYCDAAGRYRFDALPSGPHRLLVNGGFAGLALRAIDGDTKVDVALGEGARAAGIVRLPDGSPAAGALVQLVLVTPDESAAGGGRSVYVFGRADGDGRISARGLLDCLSYTAWGMTTQEGAGFVGSITGMKEQLGGIELKLATHRGRF